MWLFYLYIVRHFKTLIQSYSIITSMISMICSTKWYAIYILYTCRQFSFPPSPKAGTGIGSWSSRWGHPQIWMDGHDLPVKLWSLGWNMSFNMFVQGTIWCKTYMLMVFLLPQWLFRTSLLDHPFLLSSRCAQQKASLNGALDALANSGQWVWVPGWDGRF